MTSYIEKTGAIVQVTGRMCDFNSYQHTIVVAVEPEDIKVVRNAPQPGSKILDQFIGRRVHTIEAIARDAVTTTDGNTFHWFSVVELTPEKEAELEAEKKQKQEEEWRKQAAAIPVPLLLESIQERIQK